MSKKPEKTALQIELENEAKAKEIIDKEQIKELNRAMIQGLDLNKAAKTIYGPNKTDGKPKEGGNLRLKNRDEINFNRNRHE